MIELEGKRRFLYQWEQDKRVVLGACNPGTYVLFSSCNDQEDRAQVVRAYEADGCIYANIPNNLLQHSGYIRVIVMPDANDADQHPAETHIRVAQMEKPDDYVYTESEVLSYRTLEGRMARMEEKWENGGDPGEDGFSPVVSVEEIEGGHRVTITDKNGEKTFDVMDGKDGQGGSGGSGDSAIIDVTELPTENIREDCFYRMLSAEFVTQDGGIDGWTCYCVNGLPSVGKPVSVDMVSITAYYNTQDNEVYGYADSMISAVGGVPVGWYPIGVLGQAFDVPWGGVITDDSEADESVKVLLSKDFYIHQDGWRKVPYAYEKLPEFDITWDGDMTNHFVLDMSALGYEEGIYFVKVSDLVLARENLIGGTVVDSDRHSMAITTDLIDDKTFPGALAISNVVVIVMEQSELNGALGLPDGYITNGVYFYSNPTFYVARLNAERQIVAISEKYLPETVATVSYVNELITGAIGGSY